MKQTSFIIFLLLDITACTGTKVTPPTESQLDTRPPEKIALALGGGAARGFAHIGVIKALEAQGISADIIAAASAGSVVGALDVSGLNGFQIQELSMGMEEEQIRRFRFLQMHARDGDLGQTRLHQGAGAGEFLQR
jgi:NTE family protein